MTDQTREEEGAASTDVQTDVEHYPDGFHSGAGAGVDERHRHEPDPGDPGAWCTECGDRAISRCICGAGLCGRHAETQAGYCSNHTQIQTRYGSVGACVLRIDDEWSIVVNLREFRRGRDDRKEIDVEDVEGAVRDRLPAALIDKAAEAASDALDAAREDTDVDTLSDVAAIDDALAFAQVADGDRRRGWVRQAYQMVEQLADDETVPAGVRVDLSIVEGYLQQLGAHRDDGGEVDA